MHSSRNYYLILALGFALACSWNVQAQDRPLTVLWLASGIAPDNASMYQFVEGAEKSLGRKVEVRFVETGFSPFESISILRSAALRSGASVVVGLSRTEVDFFDRLGALQSFPSDQVQGTLPISSYLFKDEKSLEALAVPFNVTVPMICTARGAGSFFSHSPSLLEIVFKGPPRIAMPDPRSDPAGRAVLLSFFQRSEGLGYGWDMAKELDAHVNQYLATSWDACSLVQNGAADVGFTTLVAANRLSDMETRVILDGALIPTEYAAILAGEVSIDMDVKDASSLLAWISGPFMEQQLSLLQHRLAQLGQDYDFKGAAYSRGSLQYVPTQQILDEWAYRYDFKSVGWQGNVQ